MAGSDSSRTPDWIVEASAEDGLLTDGELATLEEACRWVLASEQARDGEVSIAIVSDDTISALNEQYLSHTGPTDVISFPLEDPVRLVGDIYIGLDQARRQADEVGVAHDQELARLVIHGTLHVLGWDHPEGGSSPMYNRQEELLRGFLDR